MKVYDPNSICVKCGCHAVSTNYLCGVMKRKCTRCYYDWEEKPLDEASPNDLLSKMEAANRKPVS